MNQKDDMTFRQDCGAIRKKLDFFSYISAVDDQMPPIHTKTKHWMATEIRARATSAFRGKFDFPNSWEIVDGPS